MLGAGGENRTLITCLEGTYISHYTTPARSVIITPILKNVEFFVVRVVLQAIRDLYG